MITKTPVGVVERDEQLAIARFPIAAHARLKLGKRDASPAGGGQGAHLHREPMRGDASDAKLSTPFDLVITQDGRDHGGVASKLRAEKRCVWGHSDAGAAETACPARALLELRCVYQLRGFVPREHQ